MQDLTSITHLSKICLFQSTTESDTHSRLTGVSEGQENFEKHEKKSNGGRPLNREFFLNVF